jgi:hypothetical protein
VDVEAGRAIRVSRVVLDRFLYAKLRMAQSRGPDQPVGVPCDDVMARDIQDRLIPNEASKTGTAHAGYGSGEVAEWLKAAVC